jgi:hypothetical protein
MISSGMELSLCKSASYIFCMTVSSTSLVAWTYFYQPAKNQCRFAVTKPSVYLVRRQPIGDGFGSTTMWNIFRRMRLFYRRHRLNDI